MRTIELQRHGDWSEAFLTESDHIRAALGQVVVDIHHIGSTAIPGIAAKPVVDIILVVSSLAHLEQSEHSLAPMGYESLGEYGLSGRRFYCKGGNHRTHHVHAYESGHPAIHRHIAFRDYLKAHPEKASLYEHAKLDAAQRFRESPVDYTEAKSSTIRALESEALQWADSAL